MRRRLFQWFTDDERTDWSEPTLCDQWRKVWAIPNEEIRAGAARGDSDPHRTASHAGRVPRPLALLTGKD